MKDTQVAKLQKTQHEAEHIPSVFNEAEMNLSLPVPQLSSAQLFIYRNKPAVSLSSSVLISISATIKLLLLI